MNKALLEKLSDAQLVARFSLGNYEDQKTILPILYDRYKRLILKVCYSYVKDYELANDLFHDTFIKIIENMDKLSNPAVFKSWSMMIAKNICVDYLRRASVLKEHEKGLVRIGVSYGTRMEEKYIAEIDRKTVLRQLQDCIKQLADADLNLLKLRWQGFKAAQIQQALKLEKAEVRRSYDRIKYTLEPCMERKGLRTSMDEIIRLGESSGQE